MNLPEPIFEAIRSDKLVLWIGAGFSQHRLGLPDWNGLVTEIARRGLEASEPARYASIKTDLEEGRRSAIAVLAELEPFAPAAHALIVEKFLINRERNDPALQDFHTLWDISRKIITTNYDTGLDLARPGKVPKVQPHLSYQLNQLLNQYEGAFYYKLHGCAEEDPGRCILFPNQYDELYRGTSEVNLDTLTDEETPGKFLLKHLIAGHTILFIGFRMEPAARYMLEYGQRLLGDLGRPHFRLVRKGAGNETWPFVQNLEIDTWDALPALLAELAREKRAHVPPPFRGVYPQTFDLPYVGREADVAHLNEFFRDPAQNFRFLHGMGGVGKSHLLWTVWQTLDTQPVYYRLGPADSLEGLALELGYGDIALLPPPAKTKAFLEAAARERQPMVFDDFYEVRDPHLYRALLDLRNIPGIKTLLISRSLPPDFIGVDVRDKAREITDLPREAFFNCLRGFHQKVFADKYDLTDALLDTCWDHCRGYPLGGQFLLGLKEFDPDFDLSLTHIGRLDLESDPEREGFMTRLLDVILQKGTEAERQLAREAAAFTEPLPQRVYERLPAWDKTAFHTLWRRKHLFFQQAGGLFGAHPLVRTVLESKLGLSVPAHVCAGAYYETLSADDRDLRLSRLQKALYHFDKSRSESDDTHWQGFVVRMRPQFIDLNVKQLVDDNAESTIERLQFRLALSPDDPAAMNELGMAFRRAGKLEESIIILKKSADAGNVQSMNELGMSYREANELMKSIEVLEIAVEKGS